MSELMNLKIDERFLTRVYRSERVVEIAEAFGIGLDEKEFVVYDGLDLPVKKGDVIYITGQSGGGKSVLLRNLAKQFSAMPGERVVNLDQIELDDSAALIDLIGSDTTDALRLLNAVGITDAFVYLRKPSELSDGQRYRFRMAKAIETGATVWCCDEFLAILDRTSAKIIAYSLQKVARRHGATLIVATTHTDLTRDLGPDLVVNKRFREKVLVERIEEAAARCAERTVTREELQSWIGEFTP
ncbi:AAA family ATPase [Chromobacterium sp. ASV23]|uniref:ATP-binding cassette domain-containing protein n=1 Tax=Chromobacterium sp. ASV23 TaxID=2795110 RepID=UPI0018EBFA9A|nr:AAA family ATPase [Chromobacterium sp. ASV23]